VLFTYLNQSCVKSESDVRKYLQLTVKTKVYELVHKI